MPDKDRIKMMADVNWKPANTYWKEQFDRLSAELQAEREHADRLAQFLDESISDMRLSERKDNNIRGMQAMAEITSHLKRRQK